MLDPLIISVMIGVMIGLVMAMTGAGGSILAVPVLAFCLNISMAQAAPIALLAVMLASLIGAAQGLYAGTVRYKTALLITAFGIVFAPIGVWLAKLASNQLLSAIFAIVLAYVAWQMWQQSTKNAQADENKPTPACMINPATSRLFWTAPCTRKLVTTGSIAGLLSGLLGVGGGFVVVPSLLKVSNFNMQTIVATSLMAIALVSLASVSTYLFHGEIDWKIAIPFVISTMLSMLIFRSVSHKVSANIIQRGFALLALLAASSLLIK